MCEINKLSAEIVKLLAENNLKISAAESCTGGMFAKIITDISGSSAVLDESYVTYANEAKTKILGVKKETLDKFGAVSEETVFEMADGLYKLTNADICVCFSGIAGPTGGSSEKPVGLVYSSLAIKGIITIYKNIFVGTRDEVRTLACKFMLEKIKEKIL